MEKLLDDSLEIRSDPNPISKKKKSRKKKATRNDDHIDELVMIAL
jgi:hypothetical protein